VKTPLLSPTLIGCVVLSWRPPSNERPPPLLLSKERLLLPLPLLPTALLL
jgi:hypothetical protein